MAGKRWREMLGGALKGSVGGKVWAALKENLRMKGLNEAT